MTDSEVAQLTCTELIGDVFEESKVVAEDVILLLYYYLQVLTVHYDHLHGYEVVDDVLQDVRA